MSARRIVMISSTVRDLPEHRSGIRDACERAGYPLSHEAVQTLYDVIDLAPVTASSIRKTFTSRIGLWLTPLIDAATSANDFDLRELRKRRISIYARINPDNIARLQPLLNLFFQQAIGLSAGACSASPVRRSKQAWCQGQRTVPSATTPSASGPW